MTKSLSSNAVSKLLTNKMIVVIGDSVQRGIYKDFVSLLQRDEVMSERDLKAKGEMSFMGDELIEGGVKGSLTNGISYTEVRQYCTEDHLLRFYFVTRCYNAYVESILTDLHEGLPPDIVIINSCLWDMTRYGSNAILEYKINLRILFSRLKEVLPPYCIVIWNTTLPISRHARGGFLVQEIEYKQCWLRMDVLEANQYAFLLTTEYDFDILDLHFWFRQKLDLRAADGIHWSPKAHRQITARIMNHICTSWEMEHSFILSFRENPLPRLHPRLPESPRIPLHILQTANRVLPDKAQKRHTQGHAGCRADYDYERPGPYPGRSSCNKTSLPQSLTDVRGNNSERVDHHQVQLDQCFSAVFPQFKVPKSFNSQWTPYFESSLRGPERQHNHTNGNRRKHR